MLLGCIGDDFTGSSDLANTLAKGGMRVVQYNGLPDGPAGAEVEAGVVALKCRSIPPDQAVAQALAALTWLQAQGAEQIFFKYCSTFDSTPEGNIGPVADALAAALDARKVIACPAFPGTGRTVFQGHLFVTDRLLSESGMEAHPLTPMTDPDLRRCLARQSRHSVGHVAMADIGQGADAIRAALAREDAAGHRMIIADAIEDRNLVDIGRAAADLPLITGGSGVALGLPENFRARKAIGAAPPGWSGQDGPAAILSGSCSQATRAQIATHLADHPGMEIAARDVISGRISPEDAADFVARSAGQSAGQSVGHPIVYSSADPAQVQAVQAEFGRAASAAALEGFFADLARLLVARGITRLITAGGETSGAVVAGLAITQFEIGPEIDPGVPALRAGPDLVLALKSGNFGAPDFFAKAARHLAGT